MFICCPTFQRFLLFLKLHSNHYCLEHSSLCAYMSCAALYDSPPQFLFYSYLPPKVVLCWIHTFCLSFLFYARPLRCIISYCTWVHTVKFPPPPCILHIQSIPVTKAHLILVRSEVGRINCLSTLSVLALCLQNSHALNGVRLICLGMVIVCRGSAQRQRDL